MTIEDPDERTAPRDPAVLQRIQPAWPKVMAAEIDREQSTKNVLAEFTAEARELLEELQYEREERAEVCPRSP